MDKDLSQEQGVTRVRTHTPRIKTRVTDAFSVLPPPPSPPPLPTPRDPRHRTLSHGQISIKVTENRQHMPAPADKKQSRRHLPPQGESSVSQTPRQPTPIRLSLPPTRVHPSCVPMAHAPLFPKGVRIEDKPSRAQPARSPCPRAPGPRPLPCGPTTGIGRFSPRLGLSREGSLTSPRPSATSTNSPSSAGAASRNSQVQSCKLKDGGKGGEKRRARCPPRDSRRRLLPASRNQQHKMATRSREPALRPPSTY